MQLQACVNAREKKKDLEILSNKVAKKTKNQTDTGTGNVVAEVQTTKEM